MSEQPPNPGQDPTQPDPTQPDATQPPQYGSQPPPPYGSQPPPPPPPAGSAPYGTPASGYGAGQPPMPPPLPGSTDPYFSPTQAVGYGWRAFKGNAGPFLGLAVLMLVVGGVFSALGDAGSSGFARQLVFQLAGQVVSYLLAAALIKGALDAVSGRPVSFGSMFEGWDKVQVLIASVLLGVGTMIGLILLVIPGIIFAVLTAFTMYFVVDRHDDAVTAIKNSIGLVRANLGSTIMLGLVSIGVALLGLLALCVGIFVAIPVIYIAAAYAYRVFQGQPVAVQS